MRKETAMKAVFSFATFLINKKYLYQEGLYLKAEKSVLQ